MSLTASALSLHSSSMAGSARLLHPLLHSRHSPPQTHPLIFSNPTLSLLRNNANSTRLRSPTPPKFSSSSSPSKSPAPQEPTSTTEEEGKNSAQEIGSVPFSGSVSRFLQRIRSEGIVLDIVNIALPAVLALAADPIASLVDTAFVGHLGSIELAAVGVSVSVFNLVSKLFNIPLLNITTSFVAEEQALDSKMKRDSGLGPKLVHGDTDAEGRKFLPAVSTSLALAAIIGIAEAIALSMGSGLLMNFMGISVDSPMRIPAEQFLTLRAYGAPPIVIALAAQGTFRGFMDTKTPLYAVGAGNLLNAILDPILIFLLGLGTGGAAVATVVSEYMIAFFLLWKLNKKVILVPPNIIRTEVGRYLKSGGLLIGRTIAVLLTMTLSTSLAAREGPTPMAGHQICLQVWLAVSLLNDALALAGQALLASEYTQGNYKQARLVIYRVLQIGVVTGIVLAIFLFFGFGTFANIFTTDLAVLDISRSGLLFVTLSQPVNALAFVFDGLYYGVSDFAFAAYSMVVVGLLSSLFLLMVAPAFGLAGVWTGLFLFMSLRAVAGFWRLGSKGGPWKLVWAEMEERMMEK